MEHVGAARPAGVLVGTVSVVKTNPAKVCMLTWSVVVKGVVRPLLPNCGVSGCGLAGDGVLAIAAAGVKTSMSGSEVT